MEPQYRKNLMLVSTVVLMFSIAGGKLGTKISFSGGEVTFAHPEYIELAFIISMLFLQWRHWLVSASIRARQYTETVSNAIVPNRFIEFFMFAVDKRCKVIRRDGLIFLKNGDMDIEEALKISIEGVSLSTFITRLDVVQKNHAAAGFNMTYGLGIGEWKEPYDLSTKEIMLCPFQKDAQGVKGLLFRVSVFNFPAYVLSNIFYRWAWLKSAITETWFGDALLPATMTITATLAYFLSRISVI